MHMGQTICGCKSTPGMLDQGPMLSLRLSQDAAPKGASPRRAQAAPQQQRHPRHNQAHKAS